MKLRVLLGKLAEDPRATKAYIINLSEGLEGTHWIGVVPIDGNLVWVIKASFSEEPSPCLKQVLLIRIGKGKAI